MPLVFFAKAPSNIALIKYMGKKDAARNLPENASVSMTLDALCSVVELEVVPGQGLASQGSAEWRPEAPARSVGRAIQVPDLGEAGIGKVLRHLERTRAAARELLPRFGIALRDCEAGEKWVLRSGNTFPQASGIASSASSFAALTLAGSAACAADRASFERAWAGEAGLRSALAAVSRVGSGSSCRSLDGPWVRWQGEEVSTIRSSLPPLAHFVLLVSREAKQVSSSQAHALVKGSPLWPGRPLRADARAERIAEAIARGALGEVARLAWQDAWEMHSLFHTAEEPFSYWEPGSLRVLRALAPALREDRPPIVTLDAGPNVHVSVEASRAAEWEPRLSALGFELLRDGQGAGGRLI
ncbi:MAG: hypothetical protein NDJ89_00385 [Oligoflexia bacterium]|nr:hypothetical protein [Oligoflexia bacterium]